MGPAKENKSIELKLSSPVKAFWIYNGNVYNLLHHCKTVAVQFMMVSIHDDPELDMVLQI